MLEAKREPMFSVYNLSLVSCDIMLLLLLLLLLELLGVGGMAIGTGLQSGVTLGVLLMLGGVVVMLLLEVDSLETLLLLLFL